MSRGHLPAEPAGDSSHAAVQAWTQIHGEAAGRDKKSDTKWKEKYHSKEIIWYKLKSCINIFTEVEVQTYLQSTKMWLLIMQNGPFQKNI